MESTGIQITRLARVAVATISAVPTALLIGTALGSLITNETTEGAGATPVATA